MVNYKPIGTLLKAQTKFSLNDTLLDDPSHFQRLVGSLLYLTLTSPDLTYNVNFFLSKFMHSPTVTHLKMIRRILQFLKGIIEVGLQFTFSIALDFFAFSMQIVQGVLPLDDQPLVTTSFLAIISYPDVKRKNTQSLAQAQKLSIVQWLTLLLNSLG
jgi:hypothetical protein